MNASATLLVLGQGASTIGDGCYAVALPWYVLASRGSIGLLGITLAAYGVARTAAMPAGCHKSAWPVSCSDDQRQQ
jgi:hypothetical protein